MTFQFPWYISIVPAVMSTGLLLIGISLWNRVRALAVILILVGISFGALFGPMLFLDTVSIDEHRLTQRTGFWFAPTTKGFELEEASRVRITTGRDLKGRPIEIWVVERTAGDSLEIDPGDLWERNGAAIAAILEERGIPVIRER